MRDFSLFEMLLLLFSLNSDIENIHQEKQNEFSNIYRMSLKRIEKQNSKYWKWRTRATFVPGEYVCFFPVRHEHIHPINMQSYTGKKAKHKKLDLTLHMTYLRCSYDEHAFFYDPILTGWFFSRLRFAETYFCCCVCWTAKYRHIRQTFQYERIIHLAEPVAGVLFIQHKNQFVIPLIYCFAIDFRIFPSYLYA